MTTTTTPRLIALGFAGLGLTTALAGCSAATGNTGDESGATVDSETSAEYADGTYTAEGDYVSPAGPSKVSVEITLAGDIVTGVTVTPESTDSTARGFQTQFADGIGAVVEGEDIDTLAVSRVGGSSLTSGGFKDAIEKIKAEAAES
ncbi:MAG: hypothetical protein WBL06_01690 [Pseudolysinimonas sp.]|uniref:hypothetical protein n=1 Tax=Pseudolysinimonas sp. TaxID=2680009 RepID=UPI003C757064